MHNLTKVAVLAALLAAAPRAAEAKSTYLSSFNSKYGTANTVLDDCNTCHGSGGTSTFNAYGSALRSNISSGIAAALTAVEPLDSDRDGYTNLVEIQARTQPGDASDFPAPASAPKIAVSPTSLSFGTLAVGSTSTQTTTVSNSGNANLTVTASRCSGTSAEFAVSPTAQFTVAPGGRQTVTVTYAPVDATTDRGCVQLANNDATAGTVQVTVSGTGEAAPTPNPTVDVDITRFSVAKRLDVSRGGTTNPMVSVVNAGAVPGTVTIAVEGVDAAGLPVYSATQAVTLDPGATAKVRMGEFAPTTPGQITWTATVEDADPDVDAATAATKVVP